MSKAPLVLLVSAAFALWCSAQEKAIPPAKVEGKLVEAVWGKPEDREGDCIFQFSDPASLTIAVPGTKTPHSFAAEINATSAPRVLQPVTGDFNVQASVEGEFLPGGESTQPAKPGYMGAALVYMADARNYVTLARAAVQAPGGNPATYVNFEIRVDGKNQRFGSPTDRPITSDRPLFLRMEKRGRRVSGFVSEDGTMWEPLPPKDLPETWPDAAKVGVVAMSTSWGEFKPKFSQFKLERNATETMAKKEAAGAAEK